MSFIIFMAVSAALFGQETVSVIFLSDGSIVKGTIVDEMSDVELTLRLEDGSTLIIERGRIERIEEVAAEDLKSEEPAEKEDKTIVTESTTVETEDGGVSVEYKKEVVTRNWDPKPNAMFHSGNVFAYFSYHTSTGASGIGGAGYTFRLLTSSTGTLPDERGGSRNGFDFRANLLATAQISQAYGFLFNIQPTASGAWSWYKFRPFDEMTLQQPGSGITLGLQAGFNILFFSSGVSPSFTYSPFFSYDIYRYNPNTATYRVYSIGLVLWPWPFSLGLSFAFSFA